MSLAEQHCVFPKDRTVTASDGTRIAYTVVGDDLAEVGPKTPILFVNGWTCPASYWIEIGQSGLPRPAGLLARNLRPEDVAPERLAADLIEVLDDAGIDKAVLAGHSMGVQIIVEAARKHPDRVAGLVPIAGRSRTPCAPSPTRRSSTPSTRSPTSSSASCPSSS